MKFNEILRNVRKSKNLTTYDLAKMVGVKNYVITNWETCRTKPSIDDLLKLSEVLNMSVDSLLGNKIEENEDYIDITKLIKRYEESLLIDDFYDLFIDLSSDDRLKLLNVLKEVKKNFL